MISTAEHQGVWRSTDAAGWAAEAEPRLRPLYEAVLARLPAPPSLVLDAGCGAGAFAALAAASGHGLCGLDAALALTSRARARLPECDFRVGDLEALPYPDATFTAVVAVNSVLYAAEPRRALAELSRVLAPGGQAVVTMGTGAESRACAARIDPLLPAAALASSRTSLNLDDAGAADAALAEACLSMEHHEEVRWTLTFGGIEVAIAAQLPAGPVQAAIDHAGLAAVVDALRAFFAPFAAGGDGVVHLPTAYQVVVANRPAASPTGGRS